MSRRSPQGEGGLINSFPASQESDGLSADPREDFWRRVMDYEDAPLVTDAQRLQDAGIDLPDPDAMDDSQLTAKLWQVIEALAGLDVFITSTDHLSDRQTRRTIATDTCRRRTMTSHLMVMLERNSVLFDLVQKFDNFAVHLERLDVGDYVIDGGTIVERKTYADFATSLVGGRLLPQAAALVQGPHRPVLSRKLYGLPQIMNLLDVGTMSPRTLALPTSLNHFDVRPVPRRSA